DSTMSRRLDLANVVKLLCKLQVAPACAFGLGYIARVEERRRKEVGSATLLNRRRRICADRFQSRAGVAIKAAIVQRGTPLQHRFRGQRWRRVAQGKVMQAVMVEEGTEKLL